MNIDPNTTLVQEAKKCRYSLIPSSLSVEDVAVIWQNVSQFITRQLLQNKAVNITGLGLFSVLQRSLDVGSERKVYVQRPIFVLSEKFAKTHALVYTKYQSPGDIPVVQLNLAVISMELEQDRDVVDICIREIIGVFSRTTNSKRCSTLAFKDIGQLTIKDGKVKMKFFKDFLRKMDGTRALTSRPGLLLQTRPHTSDSFISRSSVLSSGGMRPASYVLPSSTNRNVWVNPAEEAELDRPPSVISNYSGNLTLSPLNTVNEEGNPVSGLCRRPASAVGSSFGSDVLAFDGGMELKKLEKLNRIQKTDLKPTLLKEGDELAPIKKTECKENAVTFVEEKLDKTVSSPEIAGGCKHNSGQELCYLCHQRQRRNVPITFTEEKKAAESELDRILTQYQQFKDNKFYEQEKRYASREKEMSKEVADCNLALAEKVRIEKLPDKSFHQSYIFARRPPVPSRFLNQEQYSGVLDEHVKMRTDRKQKEKQEADKQEREEQQYLRKELSAAKQRSTESKAAAMKEYQAALYTQLQNKPYRYPPAVPDSETPIFGRIDVNPDRVREMRKRAREVMNHQLKTVEDRKTAKKLEKQQGIQFEVGMLTRAKTEMREDCYKKYLMRKGVRDDLERSWTTQNQLKITRDTDELKHRMKSGLLVLDQCDRYKRCEQCKRCCGNLGASNVWKESRYIAGARLIV